MSLGVRLAALSALDDHVALVLGKRQHHGAHHFRHWRQVTIFVGLKSPNIADVQRDPLRLEFIHDLQGLFDVAPEAVELGNDKGVARLHNGQELLELWAIDGGASEFFAVNLLSAHLLKL